MDLKLRILAAPTGFSGSVECMNRLIGSHAEATDVMVQECFQCENQKGQAVDISSLRQTFNDSDIDDSTVNNVVNGLTFIYGSAVMCAVDAQGDPLKDALTMYTDASSELVTCIVKHWQGVRGESDTARGKEYSIGKLDKLDWEMGVSVASSACKKLLTPYITLTFAVSEPTGKQRHQTVELSYAEFVDLKKDFTAIASKMDKL